MNLKYQPTLEKKINKKNQFISNIVANVFNYALSIIIGLWFTPYTIRHLGVAAFGLIPLAQTVISYMGLCTIVLNGAVGRFLTIALERRNFEEANQIFNTALFGNVFIVIILIAPAIYASLHAYVFFNIPPGYEHSFVWLFFCIICSFFLSVINSSFSLASFCRNRFDLSNIISMFSNLIRISCIVLLFSFYKPQIWHIGVSGLIALCFSFVGSIFIWRHLTPILFISPRYFNLGTLRKLTSMGGWFVINQIGTMLYLSIDLIVVNKMIGPEAGGQYGAIMQWSAMLRSFAGVIAGVFGPTILMLFARNNIQDLVSYSQKSMKFLGLTIAFPIGIICGFSKSLLFVWLGPKYISFAPLMSLMTFHLCVNLGVLPLFNIQVATNNVRLPGLLTCCMGIINLLLALLLAGPIGLGMYGVAIAGAIMLTTQNLIFTPWYTAHILGIKYKTFYIGTISIIISTVGLSIICWIFGNVFQIRSWLNLLCAVVLVFIAYAVYIYAVMLSKQDRKKIFYMLNPYFEKIS